MALLLLRRAIQALLVIILVTLIGFALFQHVGDPVLAMVGQDATPLQREQLRRDLGLDRPFYVQFARFAAHAAHGDFGLSFQQGRRVSTLLLERLPATAELAVVAFAIALAAGIPAGLWSGLHREGPAASALVGVSLLAVSVPTFLAGIALIMVFSVTLGWLPSYGRGATVALGWWRTGLLSLDGWKHIALPALTLSLFQFGVVARLLRSEILGILHADFIRFARARGLTERRIVYSHALRNAMLPLVTVVGVQFGSVVAFAIVTETVFQWPGLGLLFIQAIQTADVPVMAAYLCLVGFVFALVNLAVDLLYLMIDPRLRVPAVR